MLCVYFIFCIFYSIEFIEHTLNELDGIKYYKIKTYRMTAASVCCHANSESCNLP